VKQIRSMGHRPASRRHSAPRPLFRDCAVRELVDCAPEDIGIAPDLLGHGDLRTTKKHYIQAHGMTAHVRVQEMIARRRAVARRNHGREDVSIPSATADHSDKPIGR
jgi:hypothetical protein